MAVSSANQDTEEGLTEAQQERFREILGRKRESIIENAQAALEQDMQLDVNEMPDEVDQASSESIQSFSLRLRGRERVFLEKIDTALRKLAAGEFGICEDCGDRIGFKRLEARPETTLCIGCKESQERHERDFR